jgi:hypothetical protein
MRKRRHHNNKGLRQIKRGCTVEQVKRMAKRLFNHKPKMGDSMENQGIILVGEAAKQYVDSVIKYYDYHSCSLAPDFQVDLDFRNEMNKAQAELLTIFSSLTIHNDNLKVTNGELNDTLKIALKQVEDLKCCGNCKWYLTEGCPYSTKGF